MGADDRTLGQVLHRARQASTDGRDRPWPVEDWADRDPRLKAIDEVMAAEVEAVVRQRVIAEFRDYAERKIAGGVARTACYEAIEFVMGARLL